MKQYFPEHRVLAGLFKLVETLYGLHIREDKAPVWHPDVKFYTSRDRAGQMVGQFYLDLYARAVQARRRLDGRRHHPRAERSARTQTPVAYLNCNFAAPVGDKPALFTHDEVITLFHEFGHGLHHLLTQVEELGVSGINGVEWDAVELPSQFMENFCWEWDVLKHMTRHVDTGAALPKELFDKMLAAKNFQCGLRTVRQIEFSSFDMHLHDDFDPNGGRSAMDLLNEIRKEIAVHAAARLQPLPQQLLAHLRRRLRRGLLQLQMGRSAVGRRLQPVRGKRRAVARSRPPLLERNSRPGRRRPALESFKAFRGREPTIDALLRHNGMA